MINLILFGTFFIMLLLNIPIAVSLGTSAILAMLYAQDVYKRQRKGRDTTFSR